MNTVLEKGNIIAKIRRGEDLNQIIDYVKSEIYQNDMYPQYWTASIGGTAI